MTPIKVRLNHKKGNNDKDVMESSNLSLADHMFPAKKTVVKKRAPESLGNALVYNGKLCGERGFRYGALK